MLVVVGLSAFIVPKVYRQIRSNQIVDSFPMGGVEIPSDQEYEEMLKNQPSDIEGWSKYDKYKMQLSLEDGSDTDGDGLTDKEEIEIYGSNPKKVSTADDLYTDKYKVEHGMDVNTYCTDPDGAVAEYNECPEVIPVIKSADDLGVVVEDKTGTSELSGKEILKEYSLYYYRQPTIQIDLEKIRNDTVNDLDVEVILYEDYEKKKVNTEINDGVLTIQYQFDFYSMYDLYLVQKQPFSVTGLLSSAFVSDTPQFSTPVSYKSLVYGAPIFWLFGKPIHVSYYLGSRDEADDAVFKQQVITSIEQATGSKKYNNVDFHKKTKYEVNAQELLLNTILPDFHLTGDPDIQHMLYCYFSTEDFVNKDSVSNKENTQNDTSSSQTFQTDKDELAFQNFGSFISEGGNCAGISHMTALLYNTGVNASSGEYNISNDGIGRTTWNIATDTANLTLTDRILSDYKDKNFVDDHASDRGLLEGDITGGEYEFVKMIGCYWREGNDRVSLAQHRLHRWEHYNYDLVNRMKSYLDTGKILDCYMLLKGGGHAVNIYGYEEDPIDPDTTWFLVYDNNIPNDQRDGLTLTHEKCKLRMQRKRKFLSDDYYVEYNYSPIKGNSKYTANSRMWNHCLVVMDENWTQI